MSSTLIQVILIPSLLAIIYSWLHVQPKIDWIPKNEGFDMPECPSDTKKQLLIFGGTSMLGKYIVQSFTNENGLCIINYGRSKCKQCHINIRGDLRDTRHVEKVFDTYQVDTVLTSVKPPLLGIHYKVYIELNLLSMLELVKVAKKKGAKNFIYVSSIAAASHYINHTNSDETFEAPKLTDYEAPYDVSKRIAEDYLLEAHETGVFNTISIRTSGIIGGDGDPYDYFRLPMIVTFNTPSVIDSNYAGNIADALVVVYRKLQQDPNVGGRFYYYTGEHLSERTMAEYASEASGKPILELPTFLLFKTIEFWTWARWEHNIYSTLDLLRMAVVPQMFDQTLFHTTFPEFKPKYTMKQAMFKLYGPKE